MATPFPKNFVPFEGIYAKMFYDVRTPSGEIVPHCWPNAGWMTETTGAQRRWWEHECEFRVSATHPMGWPQE